MIWSFCLVTGPRRASSVLPASAAVAGFGVVAELVAGERAEGGKRDFVFLERIEEGGDPLAALEKLGEGFALEDGREFGVGGDEELPGLGFASAAELGDRLLLQGRRGVGTEEAAEGGEDFRAQFAGAAEDAGDAGALVHGLGGVAEPDDEAGDHGLRVVGEGAGFIPSDGKGDGGFADVGAAEQFAKGLGELQGEDGDGFGAETVGEAAEISGSAGGGGFFLGEEGDDGRNGLGGGMHAGELLEEIEPQGGRLGGRQAQGGGEEIGGNARGDAKGGRGQVAIAELGDERGDSAGGLGARWGRGEGEESGEARAVVGSAEERGDLGSGAGGDLVVGGDDFEGVAEHRALQCLQRIGLEAAAVGNDGVERPERVDAGVGAVRVST